MFEIPSYWLAVTPDDTATLPPSLGLYVTVAGNVVFVNNGGVAVTVAVAAKSYIWADVRVVKSTLTTATGIFLLVR